MIVQRWSTWVKEPGFPYFFGVTANLNNEIKIVVGHPKMCFNGILITLNLSYLRIFIARGTLTLSVSLRTGTKSQMWKLPSLHLEIILISRDGEFRAKEACISKLYYFFNLPPKPKLCLDSSQMKLPKPKLLFPVTLKFYCFFV